MNTIVKMFNKGNTLRARADWVWELEEVSLPLPLLILVLEFFALLLAQVSSSVSFFLSPSPQKCCFSSTTSAGLSPRPFFLWPAKYTGRQKEVEVHRQEGTHEGEQLREMKDGVGKQTLL